MFAIPNICISSVAGVRTVISVSRNGHLSQQKRSPQSTETVTSGSVNRNGHIGQQKRSPRSTETFTSVNRNGHLSQQKRSPRATETVTSVNRNGHLSQQKRSPRSTETVTSVNKNGHLSQQKRSPQSTETVTSVDRNGHLSQQKRSPRSTETVTSVNRNGHLGQQKRSPQSTETVTSVDRNGHLSQQKRSPQSTKTVTSVNRNGHLSQQKRSPQSTETVTSVNRNDHIGQQQGEQSAYLCNNNIQFLRYFSNPSNKINVSSTYCPISYIIWFMFIPFMSCFYRLRKGFNTQDEQIWRPRITLPTTSIQFKKFRHTTIIRHSRLPAGNALWVCQNFIFYFIFFIYFFIFLFFFFRRQGFRMITFDRQAGPLQNFNQSHVMVIGRSVLFSDPARPPGGDVGRPKHPKIPPPPPPKNKFLFACVSEPQEHF